MRVKNTIALMIYEVGVAAGGLAACITNCLGLASMALSVGPGVGGGWYVTAPCMRGRGAATGGRAATAV